VNKNIPQTTKTKQWSYDYQARFASEHFGMALAEWVKSIQLLTTHEVES
jgi:hypothetical protein